MVIFISIRWKNISSYLCGVYEVDNKEYGKPAV